MKGPDEDLYAQPILHSPTEEPDRHWLTEGRATRNEIVGHRRRAQEALPVGKAREATLPLARGQDDTLVGNLREELRAWRASGYRGAAPASGVLLRHLAAATEREEERALHFAQREALETVVYLTERCGSSHGTVRHLKEASDACSRGLLRLALRMATGTGKTVVMACLIAWMAVNRGQGRSFGKGLARNVDRVLAICPGRTIRTSLEAKLDPRHPENLYDEFVLLPEGLRSRLNAFRVDVVNYEALQPRDDPELAGIEVGKQKGEGKPLSLKQMKRVFGTEPAEGRETLEEMWNRVLKLGRSRKRERIVVLNDEGHHCWARENGSDGVWMSALQALREQPGIDFAQAIDVSATPAFIDPAKALGAQTGRNASPLFPWIVSEFGLAESIEAGLVKIPRMPDGDAEELRNLYEANERRPLTNPGGMAGVRKAAQILHADWTETFDAWAKEGTGEPVLIAVANTKANAEALFEMLGGSRNADGSLEEGFQGLSNVIRNDRDELVRGPVRTILTVSSSVSERKEGAGALESVGKGSRLGIGRPGDRPPTAEEVQAALQTVGQAGKPGAGVRCVVSVGMLTEGWDCRHVTHILGYRKFDSQLLCEQVLGRSLRRADHHSRVEVARGDSGKVTQRLTPEYAAVVGVPFETFPASKEKSQSPPAKVHFVSPTGEDRFRIEVPVFSGYRWRTVQGELKLDASKVSAPRGAKASGSPSKARLAGAFGDETDVAPKQADCTGAWLLVSRIAEAFRDEKPPESGKGSPFGILPSFLFADAERIVREWLELHPGREVLLQDEDGRQEALDALLSAIVMQEGEVHVEGVPKDPFAPVKSASDWRRFESRLKLHATLRKSELDKAMCHSLLEVRMADAFDSSPDVLAITRNHGPERFEIPYTWKGTKHAYVPDFFLRLDRTTPDGHVVHAVVEGKGEPDDRSMRKLKETRERWLPSANRLERQNGRFWIHAEIGPEDDFVKTVLAEADAAGVSPGYPR